MHLFLEHYGPRYVYATKSGRSFLLRSCGDIQTGLHCFAGRGAECCTC